MSAKPPDNTDDQLTKRSGDDSASTPESDSPFGSFVSDSVRRSADRFRGNRKSPRARGASRSRGESTALPERRVSRRPVAAGVRPSTEQEPTQPEHARPAWLQLIIDRAGGVERALAALVVLILLLIALVWLLTALVGDNGGDSTSDQIPTEVLQVVATTDASSPEVGPSRDGTSTSAVVEGVDGVATEESAPQATATGGGSDNVLNRDNIATPTPVARLPPASCDDTCMIRLRATDKSAAVLAENGTRPSFIGTGWLWAIAEPEAVKEIAAQIETRVVQESRETLNLYMVVLPAPESDASSVSQLGEEIDSAGVYRLVEAQSVPANVRVVVDAGLIVEKVAPAPPESVTRPKERLPLAEASLDSLAREVDPERIGGIIEELQATSSTDGAGVGTRYYTTPGNQIAADDLYQRLESLGLDVWYEDFISPEGLLLVNVIGELPGEDTNRIYGVLAHFDSISDMPESSAPGADDNATGVAGSLEIARILSDYELKYSFRVVFVNGEEVGILGSDSFARKAVAEDVPWEGIFNLDSIGSPRNGYQIVLNAIGESVWMEDLIANINSEQGIGESLYILQTEEIVADDNMLRNQGLESVMVSRELYGWSPIHHTVDDVYERVSIPHAESATVIVLLAVASLLQ